MAIFPEGKVPRQPPAQQAEHHRTLGLATYRVYLRIALVFSSRSGLAYLACWGQASAGISCVVDLFDRGGEALYPSVELAGGNQ